MTDREAFERWVNEKGRVEGNDFAAYHSLAIAWFGWQAAAEHYEAVMRRAVIEAYQCGGYDASEYYKGGYDPKQIAAIIARAKEST